MAVKNNYENPLPNSSYINKDFQTIYPELLDLAKKISYKWDPSISDESDPGVVLLKLCAIIADKNNFNIDNNTLECFPETVSQEYNARPLFSQLGYFMKWFRSATTEVSFKWIGSKVDDNGNALTGSFTIPRFTMLSNYDSTKVFTLVDELELPVIGTTIVGNTIEGTITEYTMNGETLITPADLDSDNRLYFTNYNVAENGIFINNYGVSNFNDWRKVDNLAVEEYGNKVYKFGVSRDGGYCYIEFPDDIEDLMGVGINIHYVLSSGVNGNISSGVIDHFYTDVVAQDLVDSEKTITLNSENVKMTNASETLNGKDIETIDEAYKNYKKTIGTFNTLVSTRDYENFINNIEKVSNCVVSDRTTDIQNSYHIMSDVNNINKRILQVESTKEVVEISGGAETRGISPLHIEDGDPDIPDEHIEGAVIDTDPTHDPDREGISRAQLTESGNYYDIYYDKMKPYDLKLYALKWADVTDTNLYYNSTFAILPYTECFGEFAINSPNRFVDDIVDPEYGELSNSKCIQHNFKYHEPDKICLLKNKYPILIKIIPQYKLTDLQRKDVEENITQALYNKLNSKEINFGEQINYDEVFDTIVASDERIKSIALDVIEYTTYAVYFDLYSKSYKEVAISDNFADAYITGRYDASAETKFIPDDETQEFNESNFYIDIHTLSEDGYSDGKLGYYTNNVYYYDKTTKTCKLYSNKINEFRKEIYAKSVLNGNTQLLIPDNRFTYGLDHTVSNIIKDVEKVTTNVNISVQNTEAVNKDVCFGEDGSNLVGTIKGTSLVPGKLKIQYVYENNGFDTVCPIVCGTQHENVYELINSLDNNVVGEVEFNIVSSDPEEVGVVYSVMTIDPTLIGEKCLTEFSVIVSETAPYVIIPSDTFIRGTYEHDGSYYDAMIVRNGGSPAEYVNADSTGKISVTVNVDDVVFYREAIYGCEYTINGPITSSTPGLYTLRKNESIVLTAPSLVDENNYANYVKYQFHLNNNSAYSYTWSVEKGDIREINYSVADRWSSELPTGYYKFIYEKNLSNNELQWNVYYKRYENDSYALRSPNITIDNNINSNIYKIKTSDFVPSLPTEENTEFIFNVFQEEDVTIPANTVYELKSNESITFYWRNDDDSDYFYKKYVEGDKICASFALSSKYNSENIEVVNKQGVSLGYSQFYVGGELTGSGIVPNIKKSFYINKTPQFYTYNEYVETLIKERYVLSGNRNIIIKKINSVLVNDASSRCYWILNKKNDNGNFVLFNQDESEYILKSGEYFVYPDISGTALIILGSGTKIVRHKIRSDASLPIWEVEPLNYDDMVSDGVDGIDKWFDIPTAFTVETIEMQYYSLNEGTTLRLTPNSDITCDEVFFNNKGYAIYDNGERQYSIDLSDFTIEYKDNNASTFTLIPTLDTSDVLWSAYSVYSLDVANNHTQSVLSNQSIEYYTKDNDSVSGIIEGNDYLPVYMETSQSVVKDGGENINIYLEYINGKKEMIDFYTYHIFNKNNDLGSNTKIYYQGDYTTIQINGDENAEGDWVEFESAPIYCRLPIGTYVLPFKHSSSDLDGVHVKLDNVDMKAYNSVVANYERPGVYYLILNIDENTEGKLIVNGFIKKNQSTKLIFDKIYRYNRNYNISNNELNLSDGDYNRVFNKLQSLDIRNKYNYAYVVEDDEKIENPLEADSFLDNNHIFNKFTICQMDTVASDIYITNRIK